VIQGVLNGAVRFAKFGPDDETGAMNHHPIIGNLCGCVKPFHTCRDAVPLEKSDRGSA
jgi:hypothetical protein